MIASVLRTARHDDPATLESLLDLADSTITYRSRYFRARSCSRHST